VKREAFLARVSAALGREAGAGVGPVPPPPPGEMVSPSTAGLGTAEELARHFVERAEAVGARVRRAPVGEAASVAGAVARELGASVCASDDAVAREALLACGLPELAPEHADVGITGAWRGVAETGTVVLRAEPGRLEGLLPPAHVVVLREADLRRDLIETYADLDGALPSGVVQITGPSRTADIEMTLTTGVHGPGTVVIVLVGDAAVP
jgi:L-lactate dehydrogenase complex protein LldG